MAATDYEVLDPRFRACFNRTAHVERLWTGGRWTEGPAYFPAARHLIFSDIPNNRMLRFDECDGSVSVFRQPSNYATATPSIARGGSSRASTAAGASSGPSTTAPSRSSPSVQGQAAEQPE